MAHRRLPLVRALQLNSAVMVVEIAAGIGSNSFSLIMDGIHNLSDEVALLLLVLAYSLRAGLSGKLLRYANLFNSVGLLAISGFVICLSHPICSLDRSRSHCHDLSSRYRHPSRVALAGARILRPLTK